MINKNKNKNKLFIKIVIYIIVIVAIGYLLFNSSTKRILFRIIEYQKLNSNLKIEQVANKSYKETLFLLKNNPHYLQKIVKAELDLIEENEVEYRFGDKQLEH